MMSATPTDNVFLTCRGLASSDKLEEPNDKSSSAEETKEVHGDPSSSERGYVEHVGVLTMELQLVTLL